MQSRRLPPTHSLREVPTRLASKVHHPNPIHHHLHLLSFAFSLDLLPLPHLLPLSTLFELSPIRQILLPGLLLPLRSSFDVCRGGIRVELSTAVGEGFAVGDWTWSIVLFPFGLSTFFLASFGHPELVVSFLWRPLCCSSLAYASISDFSMLFGFSL